VILLICLNLIKKLESSDASAVDEYKTKFLKSINDDLNTPQALAVVQEVLKSSKLSNKDKRIII